MSETREGFDKWKFMVNTKDDLKGRLLDIQQLIREKNEQVKQLQFEVSCLYFLATTCENNLKDWNDK